MMEKCFAVTSIFSELTLSIAVKFIISPDNKFELLIFIFLLAITDKELLDFKFNEIFKLLAFNSIFLAYIVLSKSDILLYFLISFSKNGNLRSNAILSLKSKTKLLPAFIIYSEALSTINS